MLDYDYIKNYHRLTAVDLDRQKGIDAYPKAIQHIELVGQLKKYFCCKSWQYVIYVYLNNFGKKIKETWLKFSQGCVTVLWKIANYEETRVKFTNNQLFVLYCFHNIDVS